MKRRFAALILSLAISLLAAQAVLAASAFNVSSVQKGYISGLVPAPATSTTMLFGGGALDIAGRLYTLAASFSDLDCSGLGASTWYYVEVSVPASGNALSVDDFSLTTTAPAWSDALGYWERDGKRCVWAFKTDGSGYIAEFFSDGHSYWVSAPTAPLNTASPATSDTALSVGLPALGLLKWYGQVYLTQSNAQEYQLYATPAAATGGSGHLIADTINSPGSYVFNFAMYCNTSQQVTYKTTWNGSGALIINLLGFDLPKGMAR